MNEIRISGKIARIDRRPNVKANQLLSFTIRDRNYAITNKGKMTRNGKLFPVIVPLSIVVDVENIENGSEVFVIGELVDIKSYGKGSRVSIIASYIRDSDEFTKRIGECQRGE